VRRAQAAGIGAITVAETRGLQRGSLRDLMSCEQHFVPADMNRKMRRNRLPGVLRRRAAVEPVIGHLKAEHRMGRNYL